MRKAIYPGSFDPVTYGHIDLICRASAMVDELVVAVLKNSAKTPLFSVEERVKMLNEVTKGIDNVTVMSFEGMTIDFADQVGAHIMVRGLRAVSDFEYELQIAQTNRIVNPKVDTMFLVTSEEYSYLSSSILKEIARYGGPLERFAPECVIEKVKAKFSIKENEE